MVSEAMAVQDQCGDTRANSVFPASNGIASSAGLETVTGLEIKDQFSCGNDHAPKPRKPYTITKQRERWTEEEHKKFLEAVKLFGRAWRKIEEHVGTKTAVQIRSHAQKFFSKVVRDSSGCSTSLVEPVEIPPPRPKRKPMHPYPRKLVHPPVKESPKLELSGTSSSPMFCVSEQENQSPTSVLSAVGSDAFGSSDSNAPNGSLSPVSSAAPVQLGGLTFSHPSASPEESGSPSTVPVTPSSVPREKSPTNVLELELFRQDFANGGSGVGTSTRNLKLFGTTVLVTDSRRPSSPTAATCKSFPSDANGGKPLQLLPMNFMNTEYQSEDTNCAWRSIPHAGSGAGALCYMQCPNVVEAGSGSGAGSGSCPSRWNLACGVPYAIPPYNKEQKINLNSNLRGVQDKEFQKEGSWTGSNSKSVNEDDNFDKLSDVETQSCHRSLDKEEKVRDTAFKLKPSENSAFTVIRTRPEKHRKGFVPYKKCAVERGDQSLAIRGNEKYEREE